MKKIKFFLIVLVAGASCFLLFACGDGGEVFDASKNPPSPEFAPTPSISINPQILHDVVQNSPINRMLDIIKRCPTFYECHKSNIDAIARLNAVTGQQYLTSSSQLKKEDSTNNEQVKETTPTAPHLLGGSLTANSFLLFSSNLNK